MWEFRVSLMSTVTTKRFYEGMRKLNMWLKSVHKFTYPYCHSIGITLGKRLGYVQNVTLISRYPTFSFRHHMIMLVPVDTVENMNFMMQALF